MSGVKTAMERRTKRSLSNDSDEFRPVWGIRIAPRLKEQCQLASVLLRIPNYLLVSFILESWLGSNGTLLLSTRGREELARRVADYLDLEIDSPPEVGGRTTAAETDDILRIRDTWSVRGVSAETIARIHVMALGRGVPIYQLMDQIVAREWGEMGDEPIQPGVSRRISKKVSHILQRAYRSKPPEDSEEVDEEVLRKVLMRIARRGKATGHGPK
jgi:hypothetical protein